MSEELNQNEEMAPEGVTTPETTEEVVAAPVVEEAPAVEAAEEPAAVVAEEPAAVVAEEPVAVAEMDEEEGELDLTVVEEEEAFDWDKFESANQHVQPSKSSALQSDTLTSRPRTHSQV
jgi:hypothetical protein